MYILHPNHFILIALLAAEDSPKEFLLQSLAIYDKNPETTRKILCFCLRPNGGSPRDCRRMTLVKP